MQSYKYGNAYENSNIWEKQYLTAKYRFVGYENQTAKTLNLNLYQYELYFNNFILVQKPASIISLHLT